MKISIIIPVYNVEKYLRQCLDSVINQTYKDLEIICVNDASTDSSLSILEEYAQKDNRIIIVNNPINSKLGPTRNNGMKYATGEYVHFLDSDDWMELNAYEKLVKNIEKFNNPDVLHFEYKIVSEIDMSESFRVLPKNADDVYGKVFNIEKDLEMSNLWDRHAWNKLYKKSFISEKNLIFNNYPCYEDIEFAFEVLIKAKSICFINDILLNYRYNNPNSLVGRFYLYNEYAYKSLQSAFSLSSDLRSDVRKKLLTLELMNTWYIYYGGYLQKKIDYLEMRKWLQKLDYSVLDNVERKSGIFSIATDIIKYPEPIFKIKKGITKVIKRIFPGFFNLVMRIKKFVLRRK